MKGTGNQVKCMAVGPSFETMGPRSRVSGSMANYKKRTVDLSYVVSITYPIKYLLIYIMLNSVIIFKLTQYFLFRHGLG